MSKFYEIELKNNHDPRGSLTVAEFEKDIPFIVKRIFYSYNTDTNEKRGEHANINSKFYMISVAGSCKVLVDDGKVKKEFVLDRPTKALYVDNMTWKTMYDFSADNILLILSDCIYDSQEYIRDYKEFLKMVNNI